MDRMQRTPITHAESEQQPDWLVWKREQCPHAGGPGFKPQQCMHTNLYNHTQKSSNFVALELPSSGFLRGKNPA